MAGPQGGPWECAACGAESEKMYRCTECGHDMVDDSS